LFDHKTHKQGGPGWTLVVATLLNNGGVYAIPSEPCC